MTAVIFKIGSYKFAAKIEDIEYLIDNNDKSDMLPCSEKDINRIKDVIPINITEQMLVRKTDLTDDHGYVYYKSNGRVECIEVNRIEGIKAFEENEIFHSHDGMSIRGVIGYLNNGHDIVSLIDIPEFLSFYINL